MSHDFAYACIINFSAGLIDDVRWVRFRVSIIIILLLPQENAYQVRGQKL